MNQRVCIYCQLPFGASASNCPHCGGPVDPKRDGALPSAANEDVPATVGASKSRPSKFPR